MIQILLVVVIVLSGSAICSASETALFSVSELKVRQLAQSKTPAALALLEIRQHMNRPITTIVVLNNIFNIIGSIVIGGLATDILGDAWLGLFSGMLTFLIIVFGEILPKTIGERYGEKIAILIALPVKFLTLIFTPIVWVMEKVTAPFTQGEKLPTTNEAEIRLLARIGHKEGAIEDDEAEMIQRVFQLNDLTAADLMTPRIIITYLRGNSTLAECRQEIIASQHTRILVIEDSIDHVLGICLKDELLTAMIEGKNEQKIRNLTRPAKFVPATVSSDKLLKNFQQTHEHLMVVLDEYGGVSGVVSLEDVLEVLTGEIVDETDQVIDLQQIARKRRERLLQSMENG
ncbi:MAG: HlyC/CorC family transporter [Gomphosphaeria aponina SAG 52.96 = DSM 107014]|uniref:HlyC/CorC family transporter n=1 Tax=Gomphosphaeria aponina SAG 52.96 = DSM 107014 TaxID=1521640 RepID=A0A941GMG0_9CHRO|nr:HlyC/CorC family transporter [Gomphosphaeria aponina SAG 52.96 = DSM 107014]